MEPMKPFERKVIHDAMAAAGLRTESEGVEPPPGRGGCAPRNAGAMAPA